ncbi:L,D-transpeptidase family protein [Flavitalea sp.]|nr:L,D-transpeptidase family protein [Flavitalea sp.]
MLKATVLILLLLGFGIIAFQFYPEPTLPVSCVIDSIAVHKKERKLYVYSSGNLMKTFRISLGKNPIGHKLEEGDKKTPEGRYFIISRNDKSRYHKNLGISYPNEKDKALAKKLNKKPGGDIKIHGLKNGSGNISRLQRMKDWTNGCIALTDSEVDELYNHVRIGSPISIFP